jgi:hypothetical protein
MISMIFLIGVIKAMFVGWDYQPVVKFRANLLLAELLIHSLYATILFYEWHE